MSAGPRKHPEAQETVRLSVVNPEPPIFLVQPPIFRFGCLLHCHARLQHPPRSISPRFLSARVAGISETAKG